MNINEIRKTVRSRFPKATYSAKKKGLIFKRTYFYSHGHTATKHAENMRLEVQKFLDDMNIAATAVVVDYSDHFNQWPKDSWFEAVIGLQPKVETLESVAVAV